MFTIGTRVVDDPGNPCRAAAQLEPTRPSRTVGNYVAMNHDRRIGNLAARSPRVIWFRCRREAWDVEPPGSLAHADIHAHDQMSAAQG